MGTYPVHPALAGATLGNYTPTMLEGKLTITPAPLTARAISATRAYGAANPLFTGTLAGAVNGDMLTASYTAQVSATDVPGQYPILVSVSGSAMANYTLTPIPGVLIIQKAATSTALTQAGTMAADGTIRLQAQVRSSTTGAPSGSVRFLNGKILLGESTLDGGVAMLSTNQLQVGISNPLTAIDPSDRALLWEQRHWLSSCYRSGKARRLRKAGRGLAFTLLLMLGALAGGSMLTGCEQHRAMPGARMLPPMLRRTASLPRTY